MHAKTDTATSLLRDLVGFDTTSRNSNLPIIEYIADYLLNLKIPARIIPSEDGAKANLFARTGLRVLAIRNPGSRSFTIRPTPETVLDPGTILIVTGPASRAWPSATRPPSGLAATQWMGNTRLAKRLA